MKQQITDTLRKTVFLAIKSSQQISVDLNHTQHLLDRSELNCKSITIRHLYAYKYFDIKYIVLNHLWIKEETTKEIIN